MEDFELIKGKGKWWRDKITNDKIYRRGSWVYAVRNFDSKGKCCNEELIDVDNNNIDNLRRSHINFKRSITSNLMEGIRIIHTSKDMLTAGSMIDRYIKQVYLNPKLRYLEQNILLIKNLTPPQQDDSIMIFLIKNTYSYDIRNS